MYIKINLSIHSKDNTHDDSRDLFKGLRVHVSFTERSKWHISWYVVSSIFGSDFLHIIN